MLFQSKYNTELSEITGGSVTEASQIQKLTAWLHGAGVHTDSLDSDGVAALLEREDLPPHCRRALEIRASIGSASVKKAFALDRMLSGDGRMRDLFRFCGADRTGRFAGAGPQPQNMPNSGPSVVKCPHCSEVSLRSLAACPNCNSYIDASKCGIDWGIEDRKSVV